MAIRLTDRDTEILISLHSARFLTTPQITRLFWGASTGAIGPMKACQRRLHKLTAAGLVRRIEQPVKRSEASKPYLYALDEQGAAIVAHELGLSLSEMDYRASSVEDNYPFLDHLIATTDIQIAVKQACEHQGLVLDVWIDEKELRSPEHKDYVSITGHSGKQVQVGIIPDAYFLIRSQRGSMRFFVEVDRGTVTIRSQWYRGWTRKINAYTAYFSSDAYRQRFREARVRLLTVTTTEKRLAAMKEATEEAGGTDRFLFATQTQAADPGQVLSDTIWHIAGDTQPRALL